MFCAPFWLSIFSALIVDSSPVAFDLHILKVIKVFSLLFVLYGLSGRVTPKESEAVSYFSRRQVYLSRIVNIQVQALKV